MAQDSLSDFAKRIKPFVMKWINDEVGVGSSGTGTAIDISDHGDLLGLSDDDHQQYLLADATTAGNGLTISGRVLSAGVSGLGLSVDSSSIILTSTSNVSSGIARILASDSSGYLTLARLGTGGTPNYPIHIHSTTNPQVRIEYDASNYVDLYSTSAGWFYAYSIGDQIFRRTTADTNAIFYYQGNNNSFINITSNYDNSATSQGGIIFRDYTTSKWGIWKGSTNSLQIYDYDDTSYVLDITGSGDTLWTPVNDFGVRVPGYAFNIEYDATYFTSFTPSSGGTLIVEPVGNWEWDTGGNYINPVNNYEENLGMLSKKYLTLHAAELWVETLVAQETIATIGGRILVGPTTKYAVDLADTTVCTYFMRGDSVDTNNGGFETAGGGGADVFANWTENAGTGAITQASAVKRTDSYSCQLTAGSSADTYVYQDFTTTENTVYTLRLWSASNTGDTSVPRYQVYNNIGGASIIATTTTDAVAGSTTFYETHVNFTTPASCTSVRLLLRCPATNTDIGYFDDVSVTAGITITVEHNQMTAGDIAYSEAFDADATPMTKVEFFWVMDDGTANGDYFDYTVERNLDGTGENPWYAGDALFNTGSADNGFMDLYSYAGVTSGTVGPTIAGNVRNSVTYNDWDTHWAIGNMNGLYGYGSSDTYGAAFGEYVTGQPWVSVDSTNGFRVNRYTTVLGQWDTSGDIYLGNQSTEHVKLSSTAIQFIDGGTGYVYTDLTAGVLQLGYVSGGEYTQIASTGITMFGGGQQHVSLSSAGVLQLGYVAGQEYVQIDSTGIEMYGGNKKTIEINSDGTATFGQVATNQGNMYWSGTQLQFRGSTNGTVVQAYVDTDGSITAGGGDVLINSDGIELVVGSAVDDSKAYKFDSGGTVFGGVYGHASSSSVNNMTIRVKPVTSRASTLYIQAFSPSSQVTQIRNEISLDGGSTIHAYTVLDYHAGAGYLDCKVDYIRSRGGDIRYDNVLMSLGKNDGDGGTADYTVYAFRPLTTPLTNSSFAGNTFSTVGTSTIIQNTSWSTTIPSDAVAILLQIIASDSGTWGTSGLNFNVGPNSTYFYALGAVPAGGDVNNQNVGPVPCTNGDIYYRCTASGSNTLTVTLRCWGYWI